MQRNLVFASWIGLASLGVACSSEAPLSLTPTHGQVGEDAGVSSGSRGLPCDVDALLEKNCRSCHGSEPTYGAPFPLVTHADVAPRTDRILARARDDARPMPPGPNPRLSEADLSSLESWIAGGKTRSDDSCVLEPRGSDAKPLSCNVNQKMRPQGTYAIPKNATDIYACYGFDVTPAQKEHLVGLAPYVGNPKLVHHLLLFQSPTAFNAKPETCSGSAASSWRLVSGWAPGSPNFELPPEAGFPQEGTTHYVLQVHYNNPNGLDHEVDDSGFDMCTTTELRAHDADVMALGTILLNLPARATTEVTCDWQPGAYGGFTIFGANPHMHKLGRALSTYRLVNGSEASLEKVVDAAPFEFDNQVGYPASASVGANDVLRTTCKYSNTTDQTVRFGEGTGDEMCFSFVSYYPKITASFAWTTPSIMGKCRTTAR